jgi:hypothetical protein
LPPNSNRTSCQALTLKYIQYKISDNKTKDGTEEANAYRLLKKIKCCYSTDLEQTRKYAEFKTNDTGLKYKLKFLITYDVQGRKLNTHLGF